MTTSIYCRLIGKHVASFTKLGGRDVEFACPEYEATSGLCRLKSDAAEVHQLRVLLDAVGETPTGNEPRRCTLLGTSP
jgi:hypothetical protein